MPKWSQNGAKMHQKSKKNESQKNNEFREVNFDFVFSAGVPQFAPVKVNLPADKTQLRKQTKEGCDVR